MNRNDFIEIIDTSGNKMLIRKDKICRFKESKIGIGSVIVVEGDHISAKESYKEIAEEIFRLVSIKQRELK